MAHQTFKSVDVLRLEVEEDPTGLVNLIQNACGEQGGWGWMTPVTGSVLQHSDTGAQSFLAYLSPPAGGVPSYFYSEPMEISAGQYAAAVWETDAATSSNGTHRARFEWLDASGAVLSSSTQSAYFLNFSTATRSYAATVAPASTAFVRLRFDVYSNGSGGNPTAGSSFDFTRVTVAKASSSGALSGLSFIEPVTYVNILGPTHDIKITREELTAGLLTATILDASLDPATADLLRPGRRCRVTALVSGQWQPLFLGKVRNATATYDYARTDTKRARIVLTAVDRIAQLASTPVASGVAFIDALPYILEGHGVPWNVNGSGSHGSGFAIAVATNANASLLDQVAITRDSVNGYAWVDRYGVLQVWDASEISTSVAATLTEDDYSALPVDFDTDRCVNTLNLTYLRINLASGETVEVPYGPYVDQASIDEWGPHSVDMTVQGIAESPSNMAAYAAGVLAANATPVVRANSATLPILTTADLPKALIDLYDLVTVSNTNAGLSDSLRVTSLEHDITTERWLMTPGFAVEGGVAPPISTPSPSPGAVAIDTAGWVSLTHTGSAGAMRYQVSGGVVYVECSVTIALANATNVDLLAGGNEIPTALRPTLGLNMAIGRVNVAPYGAIVSAYTDGTVVVRQDTGSAAASVQFRYCYPIG